LRGFLVNWNLRSLITDMIKLINLTKMYRGLRAVDEINLEVQEGMIYGFLGPNGAGKTTTIKMMAGVLKPTSGQIIINGMDMAKQPSEVKACTGFIPDRPFLYEKLTGSEFLHFIGGLYRLDHHPALTKRVVELLELFELIHWGDELVESYSHGMKQRLIMCAALLHHPKVLIVDEPMVGLDPKGARLVKDIFRQEAAGGTTVFMSTHSLEVAQEVCQEITIIQTGKIIATGTAKDLQKKAGVDGNLENIFLTLTEGKRLAHAKSLSSA
jgi:ABC-2 type transport system ATP-binding protein